MDLVLYHPQWGYYCQRENQPGFREVGRGGDFFTNVSVGETFGLLLAHRIVREWESFFARHTPFVIVEQGAHDGRLARDILAALREMASPLLDGLEYRIVEPREGLRAILLASDEIAAEPKIRIVSSLAEATSPAGIFLCNELLDAFPFDRLIFRDASWQELQVAWDEAAGCPQWTTAPLREEWQSFAEELGTEFPEAYETEICTAVDDWTASAANLFQQGLWWIIDYGYERADYYSPQRKRGTLRCYHHHQADEDPFSSPGEKDVTAHVDFTRVESAAIRAGLKRRTFTDQHRFLIDAARPWLLAMEGKPATVRDGKRLRQFQTLTHPTMMGRSFHFLEFAKHE